MTFTSNALLISPLIDPSQWLTLPTVTLLNEARVDQAMRITMPQLRNGQRIDWQRYRLTAGAIPDPLNPATWGTPVGSLTPYTPGVSASPELGFTAADLGFEVRAVISAVGTFGPPLPVLITPSSGVVAQSVGGGGWGTMDWADILVEADDWDPVLLIRRCLMSVYSTLPAPGTNKEWIYVRTTEAATGTIAEPTTGWRSFAQTPAADEGDLDLWAAGGGVTRTWGSANGAPAGGRCVVHIGKRDTVTGERHYFGYEGFTAEAPVVTNPTDYTSFTQDVTASGVSADAAWADAMAKAQARITAGTAGRYIIGLPDYQYGSRTVTLIAGASQEIWFQSINKNLTCPHFGGGHVGGAKLQKLNVSSTQGIGFRFMNIDRTGLGWTDHLVTAHGVKRFTFEYNRVMTQKRPDTGWPVNAWGGVAGTNLSWHAVRGISFDAVSGSRPDGVTVRFNHFYGLTEEAIYFNALDNAIIEQNVLEESGTDDFKGGGTLRWVTRRDNWFARIRNNGYSTSNPNDPWSHNDGQQYSGSGTMLACQVIGDVMMVAGGTNRNKPENPYQGLFSNGTFSAVDWLYEECFILTNTVAGGSIAGSGGSGNRIRNSAFLRVWDYAFFGQDDPNNPDGKPNGLHGCYITTFNGAVEGTGLVECKNGSSVSGYANSTVFPMYWNWTGVWPAGSGTYDYTSSNVGYEALNTTSTFYEARPKTGTDYHWTAAANVRKGPAEKFRRTLVDKVGFPQFGPAWPSWKRQFDWKNQIMPAAG